MKLLIALLVLPTALHAQGLRDGDRQMDRDGLMATLSGQAVAFHDGSVARYRGDGTYSYTYQPADPPFVGRFEAGNDSRVCVTFDNGFYRCDTFVFARERLVLITEGGERFPAKAVEPLAD
jgi:hypothetical protein